MKDFYAIFTGYLAVGSDHWKFHNPEKWGQIREVSKHAHLAVFIFPIYYNGMHRHIPDKNGDWSHHVLTTVWYPSSWVLCCFQWIWHKKKLSRETYQGPPPKHIIYSEKTTKSLRNKKDYEPTEGSCYMLPIEVYGKGKGEKEKAAE